MLIIIITTVCVEGKSTPRRVKFVSGSLRQNAPFHVHLRSLNGKAVKLFSFRSSFSHVRTHKFHSLLQNHHFKLDFVTRSPHENYDYKGKKPRPVNTQKYLQIREIQFSFKNELNLGSLKSEYKLNSLF